MYLIMKCMELGDQYECDADREPITLTEDWKSWIEKTNPDYQFEIYEFQNSEFELIKGYDVPMEEGMALYYWTKEDMEMEDLVYIKPTVIQKWENKGRNEKIPQSVLNIKKTDCEGAEPTEEEFRIEVRSCGGSGWYDENENWWVYGEYFDNRYTYGF